jgi:hypothetical protein
MFAFEHVAAAQEREVNTGIIPIPSALMLGHVAEIAAITTRYRLPKSHNQTRDVPAAYRTTANRPRRANIRIPKPRPSNHSWSKQLLWAKIKPRAILLRLY